MSGKIEVKTRKGESKDKNYSSYEYWYLQITGENGQVINITPSWNDIANVLRQALAHERKMDIQRNRKPDSIRYRKFMNQMIEEEKNYKITEFNEVKK